MNSTARQTIWTDVKRHTCRLLAFALVPVSANAAVMFKPAFCALALSAGSQVEHANPLRSLTELEAKLTKMARGKPVAGNYAAQDYRNDLDRPRRIGFLHNIDITSVRERLRQLELDTTSGNEALMFAGYEFRGEAQVRKALGVFQKEGPELNARIMAGLQRRYPKARLHTFASLMLTTFMVGAPVYLWTDPQYAAIGLALTPFAWATAALNEFGLPWLQQMGQMVPEKHLAEVERGLGEIKDAPIRISANTVEAKVDLHKLLMNVDIQKLNDDELALFVDAAEGYVASYLDDRYPSREFSEETKHMTTRQRYAHLWDQAVNIAKYYPEGQIRHVYYDSIFYVENGQPVWLLYYRSFKDRPLPSQRPKEPKTQKEAKPLWEPGWAPNAARVSP